MNAAALFRLAAFAAIAGGALRIASSFLALPDLIAREWLWSGTDVLLTLGLIGIYLHRAEKLAFLGLASFVVCIGALSFIGGPDADVFGFSTYEQGAATLVIGLIGLSIAWVRSGERPLWAPLCWFGSALAGGAYGAIGAEYALMAAGVLFGAGFVFAGAALLSAGARGQ